MHNKTSTRLLILALGASLSQAWSASAPGHFPDPMSVPLMVNKGQTHLSAALGQKGEGLHLKGAVAVSDKVALIAATSYAQKDNCQSCNTSVRHHYELGAGTFGKTQGGFVREFYAGAAVGLFRASGESKKWDPQPEDIKVTAGHYDEVFLQAGIGKPNDHSTFAGAARLAGYRYYRFSKSNGYGIPLPVASSHWGLFLEPALTYKLGFKGLKTETQLGVSIPLVEAKEVNADRLWFSLGMGIDLFGR